MRPSYVIKTSIQKLAQRLAQVNVLVVDDDPKISQLVRNVLQSLGFKKIYSAKDGSSALKVMEEETIDLVITDWEMDPLDGLSFIKYLRTSPDSPNRYVPVIMLTGHAEIEDVTEARDAGVTEFVVKPFTAKTLCERIVLVIENPRSFIVSKNFKGPDRRRRDRSAAPGGQERRKHRANDVDMDELNKKYSP